MTHATALRWMRGWGITAGAVALILLPIWLAGYRWNATASLPRGIWKIQVAQVDDLKPGQIISFCPDPDHPDIRLADERGYLTRGVDCPGGLGLMFKRLIGVDGDLYHITEDGIVVNGQLLPHTRPIAADGNGDPLPHRVGFAGLLDDQFLVVSDWSPWSYDSRYFGAIHADSVRGMASPVWLTE